VVAAASGVALEISPRKTKTGVRPGLTPVFVSSGEGRQEALLEDRLGAAQPDWARVAATIPPSQARATWIGWLAELLSALLHADAEVGRDADGVSARLGRHPRSRAIAAAEDTAPSTAVLWNPRFTVAG
jgi:hypothetical protein